MPHSSLDKYRSKRSADRTPEPFGSSGAAEPRAFVVQQHAARRLHFDLRLEHDGVLWSWAVPRGPSYNPADKRLAVHTEDHPVEYVDFEGVIPDGNYGAGAMIVWDRGQWIPYGDPAAGLDAGKLLFELRGYKLKGMWTLVRTKQDWLLIKERDGWAKDADGDVFPPESVLSGLTVQQLGEGGDHAAPIRERLERVGALAGAVDARQVGLMLAQTRDAPFSSAEWAFELKLDGYRLLAVRERGSAILISRNGNDMTESFPEVARAIGRLPFDDFIIDGEVVVLDDEGRPSFQLLQRRARFLRRIDRHQLASERPAVLFAFDLLSFGGYDLRGLPLLQRKEILQEVLPPTGPLRYAEHFLEQGEALYEQVRRRGLEGIVAKKVSSIYRAGRHGDWLKIRADRTDDFVIVGFSEPKGGRGGFGALHLGQYVDGQLEYAGRVGTGFTDQQLDEIRDTLDGIAVDRPACTGAGLPASGQHHWVDPVLVCEVRYKEWTADALLRHPVFLRLREDKDHRDCVRQDATRSEPVPEPEPVPPAPGGGEASGERVVPFTNLDKVFWPDEGYTKGDLIEYYRDVSRWLLPYLRDRPVVLTRYPDGIHGKWFFQKDAPHFIPDWLRTEHIWSDQSQREIQYFICNDVESLLYIVNLGTIPLHVWSSRIDTLERPDWCILDLDPKGAPFADVVQVALALRDLTNEIGLPSYVKTSGSSGLHVLVPIAGQCTYEQSRQLGQLLAHVIVADLPEIATIARVVSKREGKVYLDYVQNGHGRLLVSPYCVRPRAGATVSATVDWSEVTPALTIEQFTIRTVPRRLERLASDPMLAVLTDRPDIVAALERLAGRAADPRRPEGDGG